MSAYKEWTLTKAGNWRSPKVRLSYAEGLLVPRSPEEGGTPKYGVTVLIPKTYDIRPLKKAIEEIVKADFDGDDDGLKLPLKDGDKMVKKNPEAEGMWVLRCQGGEKRKYRIVNAKVEPVTNEDDEVYSGRWASVSVRLSSFAWPKGKPINRGVSAYLQNVMLLDHDDPLGRAPARAEDEFEPVGSDKEDMFS